METTIVAIPVGYGNARQACNLVCEVYSTVNDLNSSFIQ